MTSKSRRFEVLLPLQFNDGRDIPPEWIADAVFEVVDHFDAASQETQRIEGHWRHGGVTYRDNLVKIVVDVPDTQENRQWMRAFKEKWKQRLEQLDIWMISHIIETGYAPDSSSPTGTDVDARAIVAWASQPPRHTGHWSQVHTQLSPFPLLSPLPRR